MAQVQIGSQSRTYRAREATPAELEGYRPQLVSVWPAYERSYHQGGQRSVFVLEPTTPAGPVGPR